MLFRRHGHLRHARVHLYGVFVRVAVEARRQRQLVHRDLVQKVVVVPGAGGLARDAFRYARVHRDDEGQRARQLRAARAAVAQRALLLCSGHIRHVLVTVQAALLVRHVEFLIIHRILPALDVVFSDAVRTIDQAFVRCVPAVLLGIDRPVDHGAVAVAPDRADVEEVIVPFVPRYGRRAQSVFVRALLGGLRRQIIGADVALLCRTHEVVGMLSQRRRQNGAHAVRRVFGGVRQLLELEHVPAVEPRPRIEVICDHRRGGGNVPAAVERNVLVLRKVISTVFHRFPRIRRLQGIQPHAAFRLPCSVEAHRQLLCAQHPLRMLRVDPTQAGLVAFRKPLRRHVRLKILVRIVFGVDRDIVRAGIARQRPFRHLIPLAAAVLHRFRDRDHVVVV